MKLATAHLTKEMLLKVGEGDFVSRMKFQGDDQLGVALFLGGSSGLDNSYSILRMYRSRFYRKCVEKVRRKYE